MQSVVAVIPKGILEHIDEILAYNWSQEQQDFEECYGLYQDRNGKFLNVEDESEVDVTTLDTDEKVKHVFQRLFIVNEWLESLKSQLHEDGRLVFSEILEKPVHCDVCDALTNDVYYVKRPVVNESGEKLCLSCFQQRMQVW